MSDNWAVMLQNMARGPQPGETFNNAFQQGIQINKQRAGQNAMAALVKNPDDPQAMEALAHIDPQAALQFRQQRLEQVRQQMGQHYDSVLKGAQLIRQMQPKDDASWQQVLHTAAQLGIDISEVPQHFDQQYVSNLMQVADAFKQGPQDPGPIREFDEATSRHLLPPNTTYQQFLQMKNPGMMSPVTIPYGAQVTPGGAQPPMTATDAQGNKVQYNPQSGQWEPMGGAGGNVSGGFQTGPQ